MHLRALGSSTDFVLPFLSETFCFWAVSKINYNYSPNERCYSNRSHTVAVKVWELMSLNKRSTPRSHTCGER